MMKVDSFFEIPCSKLRELCKRTLEVIYEKREKERDLYLESKIESHKKNLINRLFKIAPPTKEELRRYLDKTDLSLYPAWHTIDWEWDRHEETAKRLLHATKYEKHGKILISTRDYARVSGG